MALISRGVDDILRDFSAVEQALASRVGKHGMPLDVVEEGPCCAFWNPPPLRFWRLLSHEKAGTVTYST
jgi:hypothetical protein